MNFVIGIVVFLVLVLVGWIAYRYGMGAGKKTCKLCEVCEECPECPVCPVCKECPECPGCPECEVCEECPECEVCEECPECPKPLLNKKLLPLVVSSYFAVPEHPQMKIWFAYDGKKRVAAETSPDTIKVKTVDSFKFMFDDSRSYTTWPYTFELSESEDGNTVVARPIEPMNAMLSKDATIKQRNEQIAAYGFIKIRKIGNRLALTMPDPDGVANASFRMDTIDIAPITEPTRTTRSDDYMKTTANAFDDIVGNYTDVIYE